MPTEHEIAARIKRTSNYAADQLCGAVERYQAAEAEGEDGPPVAVLAGIIKEAAAWAAIIDGLAAAQMVRRYSSRNV